MLNCLLVGLGGFIGAVLRYLISLIPIKNPESFPINTFIINTIGAFAIGCIAFAVSKNENIDPKLLLFLRVGICGGFTTFSTFSLETAELIKGGSVLTAVIYVIFSIVVGVLAVMLPQLGLK
ncbi:MAG: fluoride efflux transporter CrcB [Eubacterium sp.]|nr:fluoride efflux transporter CrcB [Eubacterium sp.]MCI9642908.1 fluoride efflux transporter CrcB [Eubacterium sp.]